MAFGGFGYIPRVPRGRGTMFLIAGIVIAGLVVGAFVYPRGGVAGVVGTCTGISFVDKPAVLQTFDPEFGTETKPVDMSMSPDCSGAYAQGTWDATLLQRETGFGFGTDFTMTMRADPETLRYEVFNQQAALEEFTPGTYQAVGCVPGPAPAGTGWRSIKTGTLNCGYGPIPYTSLWVREVGVKGILLTPRPLFNVTITFSTTDGQSISKRVSSADPSSGVWTLNDKVVARCSWAGYNIVTGENPPDPRTVVTAYNAFEKRWLLGTEAEWLSYQSSRTQLDALLSAGSLFGGAPATGSTSAAYALITDPQASLPVPGRWSADGSAYEVTTAPVIQRPVIRCRVSGEFLGVVEPVGKPTLSFTGIQNPPYYAGTPGTLGFMVGNVGNFTAGFDLAATCGGVPITASPKRITIAAGEIRAETLPFSVAARGTYQCEATLTDLASGAGARQARTAIALAVQFCQPGQTRLAGLFTVEKCRADGSGWEGALFCYTAQTVTVNTNECVSFAAAEAAGQSRNDSNLCTYRVDDAFGLSITEQGVLLKRDVLFNVQTAPVIYDTTKASYSCGGVNTPGATFSVAAPQTTVAPTPTPIPAPRPMATPTDGGAPSGGAPPPSPGFEAVFAIAGLLAVSYLLSRRRGSNG